MGHTEDTLDDIRGQTDAHPQPLAEARTRLTLVRGTAVTFRGARRTYASGSLAQRTFNHPVRDGDGGLVLDRRTYPHLGPDGGGETPKKVTEELCALLGCPKPRVPSVHATATRLRYVHSRKLPVPASGAAGHYSAEELPGLLGEAGGVHAAPRGVRDARECAAVHPVAIAG
jgi:hypothetical protein